MADPASPPDSEDLRAAVAAGALDEPSAARFAAFLDARRGARAALEADDEPFELFRGFGEVFVSLGLVLLLAPLGFWVGPMIAALTGGHVLIVSGALGAVVAYSQAQYFTRRRRMALPSIVVAIAFAAFSAAFGLGVAFELSNAVGADIDRPGMTVLGPAIGFALTLFYYWRFRLPFTLAMLSGLALLAVLALADASVADTGERLSFASPTSYLDLVQAPAHALGVLFYGLVAFAVAMRFELQDPYRVARQSACAFWLHLTAAPAIVNTVCVSLYNLGGPIGYAGAALGFALVTVLALVIDRRSFLIAGIVYAGLVLAAALDAAGGGDIAAPLTLLVLGAFITFLGAKWVQARRRLLTALPDFRGKSRLPPY